MSPSSFRDERFLDPHHHQKRCHVLWLLVEDRHHLSRVLLVPEDDIALLHQAAALHQVDDEISARAVRDLQDDTVVPAEGVPTAELVAEEAIHHLGLVQGPEVAPLFRVSVLVYETDPTHTRALHLPHHEDEVLPAVAPLHHRDPSEVVPQQAGGEVQATAHTVEVGPDRGLEVYHEAGAQ